MNVFLPAFPDGKPIAATSISFGDLRTKSNLIRLVALMTAPCGRAAALRPPIHGNSGDTATCRSIGENVEFEFVDPSGSGEYHLTRDPGEKDALAHVPGAGLSLSEMMFGATKAQRFTNSDGTTLPVPIGSRPSGLNEFESLDRYFHALRPPEHVKDLTSLVSSRVVRNSMRVDYSVDYLRVTNDSVLVPITLQIPNREMSYRNHQGVQSATLNLYARITTPSGKVVQTFDEAIARDVPESLFKVALDQSSIFQKSVALRPGLYRLDVVVKDVERGNVGVIETALRVPRFEDERWLTRQHVGSCG